MDEEAKDREAWGALGLFFLGREVPLTNMLRGSSLSMAHLASNLGMPTGAPAPEGMAPI